MINVYIDNTLLASKEQTEIKDLGAFVLGILNSSDVGFARVWSYALSAEDVATLYNDGDPAGYVLPVACKYQGGSYTSDFTKGLDGWSSHRADKTVVSAENGALLISGTVDSESTLGAKLQGGFLPAHASIYGVWLQFEEPLPASVIGIRFYPFSGSSVGFLGISSDRLSAYGVSRPSGIMHIDANSYMIFNTSLSAGSAADVIKVSYVHIQHVGCVAEYLPQDLVVARKQDFPQVVFPVSTYTPSADVFRSNGQSITTAIPDQPQSNGFSGAFERFDSVTEVSTYCAYWHTYLNQQVPVRIIFEYRSNYPIYASQLSAGINATDIIEVAEANEGDARISSVAYGKRGAAFLFTRKYNDAWLEIRVLSIEVAEGTILSWLDSASQLPLNDEYLPPLLETAGSYDLTANGTPEIIYK